jgi:hypothetical protein
MDVQNSSIDNVIRYADREKYLRDEENLEDISPGFTIFILKCNRLHFEIS